MPRSYNTERRDASTEQTRVRILDAARELLAAHDNPQGFSIDAVARQADVARMTVYYQFGSRVGLLEALCDYLAARGGIEQIAHAFRQPEPLDALAEYIRVFSRFWASDRLVGRRLRGMAALDPDFEQVIQARDERRRGSLRHLVQRIASQYGRPGPEDLEETVNTLWTLTGFETFDSLAGSQRSPEEIAPVVLRLARAALDMADERPEIRETVRSVNTIALNPPSTGCDRSQNDL